MNASMSRRQLLGLAAVASAGAASQRNLALVGDALPPAPRPPLAVCIEALFTDVTVKAIGASSILRQKCVGHLLRGVPT